MDYSLLMGVHNIDMEADASEVPGSSAFNTSDDVETQGTLKEGFGNFRAN